MIELTCIECGEVFKTYPSKKHRKFCSKHCSANYNGRKRVGFKWSSEVKQKISESQKGRIVSNEHKQKVSDAITKKWNSNIYRIKMVGAANNRLPPTEETKSKISKSLKSKWDNDPEFRKSHQKAILSGRGDCPNKPEKQTIDVLNDMNVSFEFQYNVGPYITDFYIPNKNLIIEIFGDYWHANPAKYDANELISYPGGKRVKAKTIWTKDKIRIQYLNDMGYDVEVIWERELFNIKEILRTPLIGDYIYEKRNRVVINFK